MKYFLAVFVEQYCVAVYLNISGHLGIIVNLLICINLHGVEFVQSSNKLKQ